MPAIFSMPTPMQALEGSFHAKNIYSCVKIFTGKLKYLKLDAGHETSVLTLTVVHE